MTRAAITNQNSETKNHKHDHFVTGGADSAKLRSVFMDVKNIFRPLHMGL